MSVFDTFTSLVAPHECVACSQQGSLLCLPCAQRLAPAAMRCYRCQAATLHSRTCPACVALLGPNHLHQVWAACRYEGAAKQIIWHLKYSGAQAAVIPMVRQMLSALPAQLLDYDYIVPVPTASSRVRRRGYDQAKLLARCLARRAGQIYLPCLRRSGQAHQVGTGRARRMLQLRGAFMVARPARIRGKHLLLVDDVLTTGATFEAAASALYRAGAASVSAVAFARAE